MVQCRRLPLPFHITRLKNVVVQPTREPRGLASCAATTHCAGNSLLQLLAADPHVPLSFALARALFSVLLAVAVACSAVVAPVSAAGNNKRADKIADKPASPFDQSMRFVIVRSAAGYCEPNCPEWIYGEGQIDGSTPKLFRAVLKKAGKRALPLVLLSPGGNVNAAIEIGRLVRKNGMAVEIGYTRFGACRPRDAGCQSDGVEKDEFRGVVMASGAFCWSACPLILAGGKRRLSSAVSLTGVHQVTTVYQREKIFYREKYKIVNGERKVISRKIVSRKKAGTKVTTKLPKATRRLLVRYLQDMGVKKTLIDAMLSTPPDKIRRLEPVEMLTMNLITELTTGDTLTDPMQCASPASPAYCIARSPKPTSAVSPQVPPLQN
jgi:hypothetical protein